MKAQVSSGVIAAIIAVVVIVIGVIAWQMFAPKHAEGNAPDMAKMSDADKAKMGYGVTMKPPPGAHPTMAPGNQAPTR